MNPLLWAIVMAWRDRRTDDAIQLANELLDQDGTDDVSALLSMASIATLLHQSPSMPIELLAVMNQGEIDGSSLTNGVMGLEILDVLAGMDEQGNPSPAGQAILERFNMRPGNSDVIGWLCGLTHLLMLNMKMQMALPNLRDPDAAERYSFDAVRATIEQREMPNIFSWTDPGPPDAPTQD